MLTTYRTTFEKIKPGEHFYIVCERIPHQYKRTTHGSTAICLSDPDKVVKLPKLAVVYIVAVETPHRV